jgi:hypothetical protein
MLAVEFQDPNVVRCILAQGADVNLTSESNFFSIGMRAPGARHLVAPLVVAVFSHHLQIVDLLIESKANLAVRAHDDRTLLQLAVESDAPAELIRGLIRAGAQTDGVAAETVEFHRDPHGFFTKKATGLGLGSAPSFASFINSPNAAVSGAGGPTIPTAPTNPFG